MRQLFFYLRLEDESPKIAIFCDIIGHTMVAVPPHHGMLKDSGYIQPYWTPYKREKEKKTSMARKIRG